MSRELYQSLMENPIIAAVKDSEGLTRALESDSAVIFILFGDILNIAGIVDRIKNRNKHAIVHIDLVEGLGSREIAVDFLMANTRADGIISTKANLIKYAKNRGLFTIQRFFLLDSLSFTNIGKKSLQDSVDMIEVLPGVMPKIIRRVVAIAGVPVIAGGLICDKEDVVGALSAGASAISSTNAGVWSA
ncbi:glycerol-3-phosphate responsive antiterminator [Feifania hominis]|uniref:Glycerol-3-phosphate responsive antiterminator n=1 Tax=Feifania hominis TaxID=2763660 RepID=A0A926DCV9_9FIRM|nr:glycerol-3-phosphate responsive antiterminator [Feifania hominis]MBC8535494.1 glycerol-3-phosphate responsive antiterminator [Feifania hominis]